MQQSTTIKTFNDLANYYKLCEIRRSVLKMKLKDDMTPIEIEAMIRTDKKIKDSQKAWWFK